MVHGGALQAIVADLSVSARCPVALAGVGACAQGAVRVGTDLCDTGGADSVVTHVADGTWVAVITCESVLHVLVDTSSLGVALGEFALRILACVVSDALSALAPRLHGALVVVVAEAVVRQL
tara:strand:+ start:29 stop:394 length:366 start_codon:yes stop_codon:yes gene_type:complete